MACLITDVSVSLHSGILPRQGLLSFLKGDDYLSGQVVGDPDAFLADADIWLSHLSHLRTLGRLKGVMMGARLSYQHNSTACQRPRGDPFVWTRPRHCARSLLGIAIGFSLGRVVLCTHQTDHTFAVVTRSCRTLP